MKWKDVYNKCNNKKFSRITNIQDVTSIYSNVKNFIKNDKIWIISITLVIIGLLSYTFRNNITLILSSIGLFLALFVFMIINSTYKVSLGDKSIKINANFQETDIKYDSLVNIFLDRKKNLFLGIPLFTYTFNVIYIEEENPMIITLSTIMLDKKQVLQFFNQIKTEELEQQKEYEKEEKENIQTKKAITITALVVIVVAIILCGIIIYIKQK